jgi:hypothetical protein
MQFELTPLLANTQQNVDFKKERAAYLAQRNAQKKQAEMLLRR